jgi:hypothetical protein
MWGTGRNLVAQSAGLGSSLYSLGEDPTENTASNNPSIVVMDGRLAIAWVSLMCLPAVTKQRITTVLHVYATLFSKISPCQSDNAANAGRHLQFARL